MAALLVLGFAVGSPRGVDPGFLSSPAGGATVAFLAALVPVMAAYNGFQGLGSVGGEVVNPARTLPLAVILGTSLVIALYVLINWVYFHLLGFQQVALSQHVASDAAAVLVGDKGAK